MSVGLRPIHSVNTMTCGSDRSGMASSFIFLIDTSDATSAKPTPSRTRRRLRAQNSMIFSTMIASLLPGLRDGLLAVLFHRPHPAVLHLAGAARLVLVRELPGVDVAVAGGRWRG